MVVFPNAKINLGLNILSKRPDGYHNVESCFYPIELCDILEIIPAKQLAFTTSGLEIPGDSKSNLCLKAYNLIKAEHAIEPIHIHLHKVIPMGAGLGGGSADATFVLKVLNELFELSLAEEQLEMYAAQIGSDCPFFVKNKPALASGIGTTLEEALIDLSAYKIEVEFPKIHIGTQEAYAGVTPNIPSERVSELIKQPVTTWKNRLLNDFEKSIFPNHPEIETLKKTFYERGAIYASMTGSGSAVYGLFGT